MPRRNVLRRDLADTYYHVFARAGSRLRLFAAEEDFIFFLRLLERYLAPKEFRNGAGVPYANFFNKTDLVAYCLLPDQFHLLIYQRRSGELSRLMRMVMTSYSRYFNVRFKRSGALFESRYRSAVIQESYLEHVSRYIHTSARNWRDYPYSSLPYYLQQDTVAWVHEERVMSRFSNTVMYEEFMTDRTDIKKMNDILKHELADS